MAERSWKVLIVKPTMLYDHESEEAPISGDVRNSRPTDSGF